MRQPTILFLVLGTWTGLFSQTDSIKFFKKKESQWYFSWGYTRAWYSKSTIQFKDVSGRYHDKMHKTANYNFTVYDVTAADRPDFDKLGDVINFTIPQYVFRIGFMLNKKWGIEFNYDHTKYVVNDWQKARIKGMIDGNAVDGDTILDPVDFLHFEHSDGANFAMLNAVRKIELFHPSERFILSAVIKPGAGVVFPRTDVTMFGERLNNNWHVAGWIVALETGVRMEYGRRGFFEFTAKGAHADYRRSLVLGKGNGSASHSFWSAQLIATIGLRFDAKK